MAGTLKTQIKSVVTTLANVETATNNAIALLEPNNTILSTFATRQGNNALVTILYTNGGA